MAPDAGLDRDPISVLHVDDDEQLRRLFRRSLERVDGAFTVHSVGDPVEALDRLDEDVECVVSDYEMPTMNGLEFRREVSERRPDLPFILLTGRGSEEIASEAISAGIADYFRKSKILTELPGLARRIENVVERERAEVSYRELFELAVDGLALNDPETGAFVDANPAFRELLGLDRETILSMGIGQISCIPPQEGRDTTLADHLDRAATEGTTRTEECCRGPEGERFWMELQFTPIEVKGRSLVLTQARDITERRRYEQTLSALHTAVTEVVAADRPRQVTGSVLSAVEDLLAADRAAVYRHSTSENWLEVVDATSLPSVAGEVPLDSDRPVARAFIDGRPVEADGVSVFGGGTSGDAEAGRTLLTPIGSAGVLAVGYGDAGSFADDDREFTEILANAAAAAFERMEKEREIHSNREEIQRQTEELQRLERVNDVFGELSDALLRAETRDEVFEAVCDRLSDIEDVKLAWIGVPTEDDVLEPRAWAGDVPQYLDTVSLEVASRGEPAAVAARTGNTVHVPNTATDIGRQPWKRTALSQGIESVLAIPIDVDEVTAGVLSVMSGDRDAFSGRFEELVSAVASSVGETLRAVERRREVQSDDTVELAFELDEDDYLLGRLAAAAECELDVRGVVSESGDTCRVFVAVAGASPASVRDHAEEMSAVRSATVATEAGAGGVVELHLEVPLLGAGVREHPVQVRELSASADSVRATLETARSAVARDVASAVLERYPGARLLSKRTRSEDDGSYERLHAFRSALTARQLEVVHTAYLNGYFESPRQCTGTELGEKLGISSQAVYQHLRTAERRLFEEAFRQIRTVSTPSE